MKLDLSFEQNQQNINVSFEETGGQFNTNFGEISVIHDGQNGATFFPSVSDNGIISWTNDRELPNPSPVNIKGAKGDKGDKGERGLQGIQGERGADGAKGDKGDRGERGIQGERGLQGAKGEQGAQGIQGIQGIQGEKGADGFSPTVSVNAIEGGHRVTVTDKDGAHTFDVMDGQGGQGGGVAELSAPITYNNLKTLVSNNLLVSGMSYRITDYVTTTVQEGTQAAGHPFDIVVRALSENVLSEECDATLRDGDTYFANSNLGGWKLWYTMDNDATRFAWADAENGKGVIYRMIDENDNNCPYDFKNIMMRNPLDATDETYYYTFDDDGIDHSLNGNLCFNNVINKYIVTAQEINNIIFIGIKGCDVSSNFFDVQCYSNVFYRAQRNNRFGRECYENLFLGYNYVNNFDTKFRKNTVGAESQSMQFGQGATSNVIGENTYYCRFGNYFRYNTTCRYMYYSEFGHYVQNCILGESAETPDWYMRFLTLENNVQYINLCKTDKTTKTYMENIRICSGTVGKSTSRIRIEVPELAQKYAITFANNSNGELVKYCDADGGGNVNMDEIVDAVLAALPDAEGVGF